MLTRQTLAFCSTETGLFSQKTYISQMASIFYVMCTFNLAQDIVLESRQRDVCALLLCLQWIGFRLDPGWPQQGSLLTRISPKVDIITGQLGWGFKSMRKYTTLQRNW